MPSVFHHLNVPSMKPTALVKMRDVIKWLGHVGKTEITVKGKHQTLGQSGLFSQLSDELITEANPWEISRGNQGWIIGRGTITGSFTVARVPRLNGDPIASDDANDPPLANPPELPYRATDGVIAIEAKTKIYFPKSDGPYTGSPAAPFKVFNDEWLDWPAIKWADDIIETSTLTAPTSDEEAEVTTCIPIAIITSGEAFPLRSTNVLLLPMINSIVGAK